MAENVPKRSISFGGLAAFDPLTIEAQKPARPFLAQQHLLRESPNFSTEGIAASRAPVPTKGSPESSEVKINPTRPKYIWRIFRNG